MAATNTSYFKAVRYVPIGHNSADWIWATPTLKEASDEILGELLIACPVELVMHVDTKAGRLFVSTRRCRPGAAASINAMNGLKPV